VRFASAWDFSAFGRAKQLEDPPFVFGVPPTKLYGADGGREDHLSIFLRAVLAGPAERDAVEHNVASDIAGVRADRLITFSADRHLFLRVLARCAVTKLVPSVAPACKIFLVTLWFDSRFKIWHVGIFFLN
jgi:hypothetical protein